VKDNRQRPPCRDVRTDTVVGMTSRPSLSWLEDPSDDSGLSWFAPDGDWRYLSYVELAEKCHRIAGALVSAGVRRNDRVAVIPRSAPDFVATFFGVLHAGATVSAIAPPQALQSGYAEHVTATLSALQPAVLVADQSIRDHLTGLRGLPAMVPVWTPEELAEEGARHPGRTPADTALIQFTSGTGGRPRGVRIPFQALEANAAAIRNWLRAGRDDEWASWLPVHHDMGLIGCMVTPVVGGNGLWLLRPKDFVRDPMNYLRCFGSGSATITATPGFGLDHILRRVDTAALDGLDFSGWRAIVVGAERVDPDTLRRFHRLLEPHGLRGRALLPAYGLAEATLAVTGVPVGRGWVDTEVRQDAPVIGLPVGGRGLRVVGCGHPVGDTSVRVVDEVGMPLPDGHLGEIEVRGGSVGAGYLDDSAAASTLCAGALRTGDAGFLRDGELYVLGRLGDRVKVRGRSIFAEDVELALKQTGVPAHRQAVVLGERRGAPVAVAVLEAPEDEWLLRARQVLRAACAGMAAVVIAAPVGTIPRTSSGKRMRRELWRAFMTGTLG
jgi:acyl-CoA synthetase (AMP-forming)/AMP-acid ligase II